MFSRLQVATSRSELYINNKLDQVPFCLHQTGNNWCPQSNQAMRRRHTTNAKNQSSSGTCSVWFWPQIPLLRWLFMWPFRRWSIK